MEELATLVESAVQAKDTPPSLLRLMNQAPGTVSDFLAERFGRCTRREECQRIAQLLNEVGPGGIAHLLEMLRYGPPGQAANSAGLLSRLDCSFLEVPLSVRLPGWSRLHQDSLIRQISLGGAARRGRLLARIFRHFDAALLGEVLDEIGLAGDTSVSPLLEKLAIGEAPQAADPYVRVKAIEALARLRSTSAIPLLRSIATARQIIGWAHEEEMRLVALQALERIDPEWTRHYLPYSRIRARDFSMAPLEPQFDSPWARARRYPRVVLNKSLGMIAETAKGSVRLQAGVMSLGGGMASTEAPLAGGVQAAVSFEAGWRNMTARVLFREPVGNQRSFEIIGISLNERARLRRVLAGAASNNHP